MVNDASTSVEDYLAKIPAERRAALEQVRAVILRNLPEGFEERMEFGMIAYVVPLSRYPKTYNKRPLAYVSLASQKNHMAVYLMHTYQNAQAAASFTEAYRATGKRLDMGRCCVRFKRLDDLPLELISEAVGSVTVGQFIAEHEAARAQSPGKKAASARVVRAKRR